MKFIILPLLLTPLALAAPTSSPDLVTRQIFGGSSTSNDFNRGRGCKGVIMLYARGSTEAGNVGTLGGPLKSQLNSALNNDFWLQGVD